MNDLYGLGQNAATGLTHSPIASAATSSTGSASSSTSPDITANDFLTLLVAELKNQDPTANTDPNAYVNQLVQVNSLQQLISINGDLTPTASTGTAPTSPSGS